jgi:transcriptional regulator with XRE-family HTH domain
MKGIGERLKQVRKKSGLSQSEFAKTIKISQSMLSGIESEREVFSDRNIKLICLEFDVDETWLRTGMGKIFVTKPQPQTIIVPDERELSSDEQELIEIYDKLISETQKNVLNYVKEKLELQELRKRTGVNIESKPTYRNNEASAVFPLEPVRPAKAPAGDLSSFEEERNTG